MRRNVLGLSIAAMVGAIGFASAGASSAFERMATRAASGAVPTSGRTRNSPNGGRHKRQTQARVQRAAQKKRNRLRSK